VQDTVADKLFEAKMKPSAGRSDWVSAPTETTDSFANKIANNIAGGLFVC
jgi:hypothetical protein